MKRLEDVFDEFVANLLTRNFSVDCALSKEGEKKAVIARHPRYKKLCLCIRVSLESDNRVIAMITDIGTFQLNEDIRVILIKNFSQYFGILPDNNIGIMIPAESADEYPIKDLCNKFTTAYNMVKDCQ